MFFSVESKGEGVLFCCECRFLFFTRLARSSAPAPRSLFASEEDKTERERKRAQKKGKRDIVDGEKKARKKEAASFRLSSAVASSFASRSSCPKQRAAAERYQDSPCRNENIY